MGVKDKIREMMMGDSEMKALARTLQCEEDIKTNLNLELARTIQGEHPEVVIGGSLGLYLHGIKLERFVDRPSDLDLIVPYYILFEGAKNVTEKSGSTEFDVSMEVAGCLVDIVINPKRRYVNIEHDGFIYKVSPLDVIWEAKCRYSISGNKKHTEDLDELCGKPRPKKVDLYSRVTYTGS